MESKSLKKMRFIKVAESRTDKIIKMIRLLSNCANKNNYEYSSSQVDQIFKAIITETKLAKQKFKPKSSQFVLRDK